MTKERMIVALAGADPGAPAWVRLMPLGEVVLGDGRDPFQVTEGSVDKIMAAWERRGNDMVIDYEHQTIAGGEAPAAGWIKELKPALDGLWARVEWTDRAREYIGSREYRYFSPVVELGADREVMDLLHVGLTNFPAIANLPPLVMKQKTGSKTEGHGCEPLNNTEDENMIEKLRQQLGLDAQAGEAEVLRVLGDWQSAQALWADLGQHLGLETPTPATVKGAVLALKAGSDKLAAIEGELTELRRERRQDKAAAAVEAAIQAGKVIPAQREWALKYAGSDLEGFTAYVAGAPQIVPVGAPGGGNPAPANSGLTNEEMIMCRALGIAPDQFKATRDEMARAGEVI